MFLFSILMVKCSPFSPSCAAITNFAFPVACHVRRISYDLYSLFLLMSFPQIFIRKGMKASQKLQKFCYIKRARSRKLHISSRLQ